MESLKQLLSYVLQEEWNDTLYDDPEICGQLAEDIVFFKPFACVEEDHSDTSSSSSVSEDSVSGSDDDEDDFEADEIEADVDESDDNADEDDDVIGEPLTCNCSSNCLAALSSFPSILRVSSLKQSDRRRLLHALACAKDLLLERIYFPLQQ